MYCHCRVQSITSPHARMATTIERLFFPLLVPLCSASSLQSFPGLTFVVVRENRQKQQEQEQHCER
ncbi:hypothetical protein M5D96_003994, partial [Drosophila gunungcola]